MVPGGMVLRNTTSSGRSARRARIAWPSWRVLSSRWLRSSLPSARERRADADDRHVERVERRRRACRALRTRPVGHARGQQLLDVGLDHRRPAGTDRATFSGLMSMPRTWCPPGETGGGGGADIAEPEIAICKPGTPRGTGGRARSSLHRTSPTWLPASAHGQAAIAATWAGGCYPDPQTLANLPPVRSEAALLGLDLRPAQAIDHLLRPGRGAEHRDAVVAARHLLHAQHRLGLDIVVVADLARRCSRSSRNSAAARRASRRCSPCRRARSRPGPGRVARRGSGSAAGQRQAAVAGARNRSGLTAPAPRR